MNFKSDRQRRAVMSNYAYRTPAEKFYGGHISIGKNELTPEQKQEAQKIAENLFGEVGYLEDAEAVDEKTANYLRGKISNTLNILQFKYNMPMWKLNEIMALSENFHNDDNSDWNKTRLKIKHIINKPNKIGGD